MSLRASPYLGDLPAQADEAISRIRHPYLDTPSSVIYNILMTLTPKQFNKLATKEDLKDFVTKDEMQNIKSDIIGAVDAVMVKLDNIEHAFVSNLAAHDRFKERISRLENYTGINQPKVKMANNS